MTRHAPKIAAFAIASVALGSLLALTVPTDLRSAPNSKLEQLGAAQVVDYPGAGRVINGQDSYPVVYSPQYLAVLGANDRARLQNWEQAAIQDGGYDQGDATRDTAIEAQGTGEVTVSRGSTDVPGEAPDNAAQSSEAEAPEG